MGSSAWMKAAPIQVNLGIVKDSSNSNDAGCPKEFSGIENSCPSTCLQVNNAPCPSAKNIRDRSWLTGLIQIWEQSNHNLESLMEKHRASLPFALPTVFHFGPAALLMLIDVRGFEPSNIQVDALGSSIRIRVVQRDSIPRSDNECGVTAKRFLERVYDLPRPIMPEIMDATVREDTLYLSSPWAVLHQPQTSFF